MKSNFLKSLNYIILLKVLLSLYILFAVNFKNDYMLKILNDDGIKIIMLFLIVYLIYSDYTLSLLLAMILIISIILFNKDNIDIIIKNNKINVSLEDIKDINVLENNEKLDNLEEINDNNSASMSIYNDTGVVDTFVEKNLSNIQNNVFNNENNEIYMSGKYDSTFITTQGRLELNK
tara:strand:- start:106 stop:636 length:531 start_codon:yes stop_codon:yes gene_type:complete